MNFPCGAVRLPLALLSDGRTGIGGERIYPPGEHEPLSRMPTASLARLHDELGSLALTEEDGPLREYVELLERQAAAELTYRINNE